MCNPMAQQIESVRDLIDLIESWEQKFFDPGVGFLPVWYRGQSTAAWKLNPGVLRPNFVSMAQSSDVQLTNDPELQVLIRERTVNKEFMRMGASLIPVEAELTEKYFIAQHHGLPTRLLDWTTNPLAALLFSVLGSPDDDGAVFVLNPRFLIPIEKDPQSTIFPLEIVEARHPLVAQLVGYVCGRDGTRNHQQPFVLPITPDLSAGRMLQQGSCFTFHMPGAPLMDDHFEVSALEKYIIPQAAKASIRITLRRMNITEATLYCDLDHLSREIRSAYGLV